MGKISLLKVISFFLLVLVLLSLACQVLAEEKRAWATDDYPDLQRTPVLCRAADAPNNAALLCDPDATLSPPNADRIEAELERLATAYQSACGPEGSYQPLQLAVAIADAIHIPAGADTHATTAEFAKRLQDAWGVGHADCHNGALLLVSLRTRSFALSIGTGLEVTLPKAKRDAVLDAMVPWLRRGDTAAAVLAALRLLDGLLLAESQKQQHRKRGPPMLRAVPSADGHLNVNEAGGGGTGSGGSGPGASHDGGGSGGGGGGGGHRSGTTAASDALRFLRRHSQFALPAGLSALFLFDSWRRAQAADFRRKVEELQALQQRSAGAADGAPSAEARSSCPVCLEPFKATVTDGGGSGGAGGEELPLGKAGLPLVELQCGHRYCRSCLGGMLRSAGASTCGPSSPCPICDPEFWQAAAAQAPGARGRKSDFRDYYRHAYAPGRGPSVGFTLGGSGSGANKGMAPRSAFTHTRRRAHDRGARPEADAGTSPAGGGGYGSGYAESDAGGGSTFEAGSGGSTAARERAFRLHSLRALHPRRMKGDVAARVARGEPLEQQKPAAAAGMGHSAWTRKGYSGSQQQRSSSSSRSGGGNFGGGRSSDASAGGW
ncbi:TLP18.3, Psb32 and MOLO-1 founding proteins of phosphatase-domain-containing protein [Tribonema minus]|uniref:TLP18.3, Psb32 and MOLO-1 founding proteins of phosphatase-domain-containing protein n=1 Tax=Tribonema minus TaxID=303371 RepID=A0A835YUD5_9STRA|nr:TLP18.3, Psb32 and MOLO-1 founding proteins of phosphatase-domain-containing protein [Tribonema minus]